MGRTGQQQRRLRHKRRPNDGAHVRAPESPCTEEVDDNDVLAMDLDPTAKPPEAETDHREPAENKQRWSRTTTKGCQSH